MHLIHNLILDCIRLRLIITYNLISKLFIIDIIATINVRRYNFHLIYELKYFKVAFFN